MNDVELKALVEQVMERVLRGENAAGSAGNAERPWNMSGTPGNAERPWNMSGAPGNAERPWNMSGAPGNAEHPWNATDSAGNPARPRNASDPAGNPAHPRNASGPAESTAQLPYTSAKKEGSEPDSGVCLDDITQINLRTQLLVKNPKDPEGYLAMKAKTPARLGIGKAGARYRTATMLRVRADHAAAQDAVFSDVSEEFIKKNGFVFVKTLCKDKDEYLTRPDLGRRFPGEELEVIRKTCGEHPKVLVIVGDGLSSSAIEANVEDMIPALCQGLQMYQITLPPILFIKYARVGAMDAVGEVTGADVICMLVGERPGLVTAESMSAYIAYQPRHGLPEAKRTVISNIHRGGTTAVEAGAHAAEVIRKILEKKASGVDLKTEAGGSQ